MLKHQREFYSFLFCILLILGGWENCHAQNYHLANTFNVDKGLASNHVYEICQDQKGFLWIATDNGISRFDGKTFYNYTVKNGLPSNDVLQVVSEKDGTIWVSCYKETPSYFDEVNNRFVSFENHPKIMQISGALMKYFVIPDGGIRFYSDLGYVDFHQKSPKTIVNDYSFGYLKIKGDNYEIVHNALTDNAGKRTEKLDLYKDNVKIQTIDAHQGGVNFTKLIKDNCLYAFFKNGEVKVYSDWELNPYSCSMKRILLPEKTKWYSFSEHYVSLIANSGNIYIYEKKSLKLIEIIENSEQINSAYIDKDGNLWVGTISKGLQYFNHSQLQTSLNTKGNNNMLCIAAPETGGFYAGNHLGQIYESKDGIEKTNTVPADVKETWIRKIIPVEQNIFLISDEGYSFNYQNIKPIYHVGSKTTISIKSAILLNPDIIILGTTGGLYQLNTKTQSQKKLNSPSTRFLGFEKINNNNFYCFDAEGLMIYNFAAESFSRIDIHKNSNKHKPCAIALDAYGRLWVATVKGDLLLLEKNKVIYVLKNEKGLPENITKLMIVNDDLWIASKSGLHILKYRFNRGRLSFMIQTLSKSDGLSSEVINDIILAKNWVYAATDNGVTSIPMSLNLPKFEIIPTLISIRINNKNVPLSKKYSLQKQERNIMLQLAGCELSGHFRKFQYSINQDKKWIDLEGNTMNLILKGGQNSLEIRAVDDNFNVSTAILKLDFFVAIPFYNKIWFWSLVVFALTGFFFWQYNLRKLNRQKQIFYQKLELEEQRNKITADLHDDIGSTLSSLQINSAVARQLIDKNPQEVKTVLSKIEIQAENLAEKIGDIIWSMKPGKEEFISMSMRIKNFANDILGSTNMHYKIETDPILDEIVVDITMRKNIVLFFKEGINNTAKYSHASEVVIKLEYLNKGICLMVKDNGKGFDQNRSLGNGLYNMKHRIEELGGHFKVLSEINKGVELSACIPFE